MQLFLCNPRSPPIFLDERENRKPLQMSAPVGIFIVHPTRTQSGFKLDSTSTVSAHPWRINELIYLFQS